MEHKLTLQRGESAEQTHAEKEVGRLIMIPRIFIPLYH